MPGRRQRRRGLCWSRCRNLLGILLAGCGLFLGSLRIGGGRRSGCRICCRFGRLRCFILLGCPGRRCSFRSLLIGLFCCRRLRKCFEVWILIVKAGIDRCFFVLLDPRGLEVGKLLRWQCLRHKCRFRRGFRFQCMIRFRLRFRFDWKYRLSL